MPQVALYFVFKYFNFLFIHWMDILSYVDLFYVDTSNLIQIIYSVFTHLKILFKVTFVILSFLLLIRK